MPSVAQVLSPGFARTWHEAVAIVQEAAHQLQPGLGLPAPEDLTLDEAGTLMFGFGDESSDEPVTALAGLLLQLLEGVEAPQSLRDLATENAKSSPAHASIASFSQALAFFERPNRANDLRAVAGRLRGFRDKTPAEQEFERLREKVAHNDEPEEPKKKPQQTKKPPRLSKVQQAIVVGSVFVVVFGSLAYRSGLHRNLGALGGGVEGAIQGVIGAGLETFGVSKAASAAPAENPLQVEDEPLERETEPAPTARPDRPVKASTRSGGAPNSRAVAARDLSRASSSSVTPEPASSGSANTPPASTRGASLSASSAARVATPGAIAAAPAPAPVTPVVTITPAPGTIFSADDPEVLAPELVRPQLPSEPRPGDDTGILNMLIDENGDVEQVKLISPRHRYHDRMLVAAAKAWKFKPAMLNGFPVKYRVRIPIILKGMP